MKLIPILALTASVVGAQETVLGVYLFSRHGDRTPKSIPPANLTDLGYQEVFTSGTYYHNRYISSTATRRIRGINDAIVKQSQIAVTAPVDTVLQVSAQGFLQGLYPPIGDLASSQLRNGTRIQSPLNGYQLIPVNQVSTGANSENSPWLQGASNCANAQISSNNYFTSDEFQKTSHDSQALYNRTYPYVNATFTQAQTNYKNAYVIWDVLNVASIHNASANLPTDADFQELKVLADQHEFALAYNNTEPIRAITGAVIAAQVVTALNNTVYGKSPKLNIQFGAYAGMLSFFGLSNLTSVDPDFYGVPDYTSSLVWELVTNSSAAVPSANDISVRFYFHNGTTSNISEPVEYHLFNTGRTPLPWNDFVQGMQKFAVSGQDAWCKACGNSTGECSPEILKPSSSPATASSTPKDDSGLSKAVCGVIGAMVTLGVILGVELLIMLLGGFRLVSKKKPASITSSEVTASPKQGV